MTESCVEQQANQGCNQERCCMITSGTQRTTGKVKWYDAVKGFGFVVGDDEEDIFVYLINILTKKEDKKRPVLIAGETVEYSVTRTVKGLDAREVSLPGGLPIPPLFSDACDNSTKVDENKGKEEPSNDHYTNTVKRSKRRHNRKNNRAEVVSEPSSAVSYDYSHTNTEQEDNTLYYSSNVDTNFLNNNNFRHNVTSCHSPHDLISSSVNRSDMTQCIASPAAEYHSHYINLPFAQPMPSSMSSHSDGENSCHSIRNSGDISMCRPERRADSQVPRGFSSVISSTSYPNSTQPFDASLYGERIRHDRYDESSDCGMKYYVPTSMSRYVPSLEYNANNVSSYPHLSYREYPDMQAGRYDENKFCGNRRLSRPTSADHPRDGDDSYSAGSVPDGYRNCGHSPAYQPIYTLPRSERGTSSDRYVDQHLNDQYVYASDRALDCRYYANTADNAHTIHVKNYRR